MPIKVISEQKETNSDHGIKKSQLDRMFKKFKESPGGSRGADGSPREITTYAHFPLKNILELLLVNKIVQTGTSIGQAINLSDYAIRVYFAQHVDADDCPVKIPGGIDYIGRNTVVLVNAHHLGNGIWEELLSDSDENGNSVESTGSSVDPREGSDKTYLCPPQCNY